MKSRMFMSFLVIALAAALVGGATMAWFTSTATNEGNTFSAGTLEVALQDDSGDPWQGPAYDVAGIAPGWSGGESTFVVKNTGTLALKYRGQFTANVSEEPNDIALYNAMMVKYSKDGGDTWTEASLSSLVAAGFTGNLAPGASDSVIIEPFLPTATGNAAQGGSFTFYLTIDATQPGNPGWTE